MNYRVEIRNTIRCPAERRIRLMQVYETIAATAAQLDADDARFNKPFSAACDLDAELQGLPQAKQAEGAR